jgi:hypothetical protein
MYRPLSEDQIGGGYIRRPGGIKSGGDKIANGTHLSREWLLKLPKATRNAMVSLGDIELYPLAPSNSAGGQKFVAHRGGGAYDVIEGVKLNDKPLTGDEARAMVA